MVESITKGISESTGLLKVWPRKETCLFQVLGSLVLFRLTTF